MDIGLLNKLIGAVGNEKYIVQSVIEQFGIDSLLSNTDILPISNKTRNALKQLEGILLNNGDLFSHVSGLTEIPKKILLQYQNKGQNISEMLIHPEKIDVDYRQFEKLRCLNKVMEDYTNETENLQEIQEKHDEWER